VYGRLVDEGLDELAEQGLWKIEYYETAGGRVPVLTWILDMTPDTQALALGYIDQLALLGLEAREPLVKPLGDKLFELRWKAEDKQYRVAYFAARGHRFVLLHGIIKKQSKWTNRDLETARKRMKDYEGRRS
jgi:phage-related protein